MNLKYVEKRNPFSELTSLGPGNSLYRGVIMVTILRPPQPLAFDTVIAKYFYSDSNPRDFNEPT